MNSKSLTYGLIGLITGATLTAVLMTSLTQAKTLTLGNNYPNSTQNLSRHQASQIAAYSQMGMMNREQMDQHFIQMMIPHHQGAIDMANLALSKAQRPEIKQLAQAIKTAQMQEIEEMKAWYKQWYGTDVPTELGMGMPMHHGMGRNDGQDNQEMSMHHGMGMMGMGMMTIDLDALTNADDFDKVFIEQMIPHHQMAVMMSAMILNSDRSEMRDLAHSIIHSQSAEIEEMHEWYQSWYQ